MSTIALSGASVEVRDGKTLIKFGRPLAAGKVPLSAAAFGPGASRMLRAPACDEEPCASGPGAALLFARRVVSSSRTLRDHTRTRRAGHDACSYAAMFDRRASDLHIATSRGKANDGRSCAAVCDCGRSRE